MLHHIKRLFGLAADKQEPETPRSGLDTFLYTVSPSSLDAELERGTEELKRLIQEEFAANRQSLAYGYYPVGDERWNRLHRLTTLLVLAQNERADRDTHIVDDCMPTFLFT